MLGGGESGCGAAILAQQKGFDVFVSDIGKVKDKYKNVLTQYEIEWEELKHSEERIFQADKVIKSPGIPETIPIILDLKNKGIPVISEIEFGAQYTDSKIIAITGSNGKTTTTLLIGHMLKKAGWDVGIAGNVGESFALQVANDPHDFYVLELSSFQLDGIVNFKPNIAILLNITPDHMDRYKDLEQYVTAKQHIFRGAKTAVSNRQDSLTAQRQRGVSQTLTFGLDSPGQGNFGLAVHDHQESLFFGNQVLLPVDEVAMKGRHNTSNALAALALGHAAGLPIESMLETLKVFKGLPHRCETIATIDNVSYINDSKGTNVGATLAAIEGFGSNSYKNLLLIAGGQGKGQDFGGLKEAADRFVKCGFVYGEDAQQLEDALDSVTEVYRADSLIEAVAGAKSAARPGDIVLLSPACASFDSFTGFEERGHCFSQAVLSTVKVDSCEGMLS